MIRCRTVDVRFGWFTTKGRPSGEAMVSIRQALFLVCLPGVIGPLALLLIVPGSSVYEHAYSAILIGLLMAALAAIRTGLIITTQLDRLSETAKLMAQGNFDVRVPAASKWSPKEVTDLSATFNDMAGKLAELRLRGIELREQAEHASESKSEFMRTITHELRSPLNAIIGFSDLLTGRSAATIAPEARERYLTDINAGAHHLLSLVNDLLDLARAESGQYDLVEDEFWLDEITRRTCRYVETQANERQMAISVHFDGEPPVIYGDEKVLFQALLNLVSNAVRYGRAGGKIAIEVRSLPSQCIELIVADDGPGIAPDDLARVLLPFQRAQNANSNGTAGSGLGLPIVKRFIELHGGSFTLSSIVGAGTRAHIILPAARVRTGDVIVVELVQQAQVARAA